MLYLGYCETSVASGLMIGPSIGSALYGSVGYEANFYVISGIFLITLQTLCLMLRNFALKQEKTARSYNQNVVILMYLGKYLGLQSSKKAEQDTS